MHNLVSLTPDLQKDLIQFTQELVRIQSFSGQEEQIIHFIAKKMQSLGYDEVRIDSMGNLIGRIGDGVQSILFDSHVDTVAVNDAPLWDVPPFSGAVEDGRLYGRGSVDMKSGAAASIYAGALAKNTGLADGKTIYVSCTVFEEDCDGENLKHLFAELNLRPDYAVICEPSNNQIALGHKGKAQVTIQTQGLSAHGSAPEKGVNAIYEMAEIIQRVEQVNLQAAVESCAARHPGDVAHLKHQRIAQRSAIRLRSLPGPADLPWRDRRDGESRNGRDRSRQAGKMADRKFIQKKLDRDGYCVRTLTPCLEDRAGSSAYANQYHCLYALFWLRSN